MPLRDKKEFNLFLKLANYQNDSMVCALEDYFTENVTFKDCLNIHSLNNSNFRKKINKLQERIKTVDEIIEVRKIGKN